MTDSSNNRRRTPHVDHVGDDGLMTVKEAGEALRLSERTIRSLLGRGVLPFVRTSPGRIGILPSDLDAYVRARRSGGGTEGTAA